MRIGIGREAHAHPVGALYDVSVLSRRVEDDDLVFGVCEDGVEDLALDGEGLARPRLAADEAHGTRQQLAVAHDEVARLLGLPVVAAALLVELLAREGHLHGDLTGSKMAGDADMVPPERKHGVQRLLLPVVQRYDAERVSLCDGNYLLDLAIKLVERVRIGVHESRVDEEPLVLVAQEVQKLLCLLLRVAKLRR